MSTRRPARAHRLIGAVAAIAVALAATGCEAAPPTSTPAISPDPGSPAAPAAPTGTSATTQPDPATPEPLETEPTVTQPPAQATPGGSAGGRLTVGQSSEISTLDPAIGYDFYSWPWERLMFETLVTYDADTNLVAQLAEAMPDVSADGLTFTFRLRDGVNFVGRDGVVVREMTADDVAYSLNRVLNPNLTPAPSPVGESYFALIAGSGPVLAGESDSASGIRVVDERTVEIEITEPDPTFLNVLAMPFGSIVPSDHAGTDTSAFSQNPIGTGPYYLVEWTPAQRAVFARNQNYWNAAAGGPSEIEVRLGMDPESQLQQVQTGSLHVMTDNIPPGQYNATINDPRWADYLQVTDTLGVNYITLDTSQDGPLGDVLVRRAISHAIDKENLVRITNNRNSAAGCFFPTNLPGHDPECDPYPYDPQRARDLLREAGYEEGFSTSLYTYDVDPGPAQAQAIQQDLADVGIELELVLQPFDTLLETIVVQGQAPMVMIGWIADFPHPSNFIDPIITCAAVEAGYNTSWYCNEAIDRMVTEAKRQEGEERIRTYQQIERITMEDAVWIPYEYPGIQIVVDPAVDFRFHPVWQFDYANYGVPD